MKYILSNDFISSLRINILLPLQHHTIEQVLDFSLTPPLNLIQHQEIFADNSSTFQRSEESGVI